MDLFDNAGTFSKLLPKISRSYALDAISAPDCEWTVCRADVVVWLSNATEVTAESFNSPGVGIDLRYEREQLSGASLLVEDQPVHVELFEDMPLEP
jgi:hypothetical protein